MDFVLWLVDLNSIFGLMNESVWVCRSEETCINYRKLLEVLKKWNMECFLKETNCPVSEFSRWSFKICSYNV